ncbi:hypothetical protein BDV25DRAFT_125065 [Aspergillus avenaceus]|uniref:Uncharacterized protein n=1 Tax=Aspergillus avenaceus TaxID=36643 RepID=A0A5N6TTZ2_ASPAV|nr:hypothetical protein BDV25DRAFT_125065 [Aspergillus avenaceus]
MALSGFSIRLQRGIRGGLKPPTPSLIRTITKDPSESEIRIAGAIHKEGTPDLQQLPERSLSASSQEVQDLIAELHDSLTALPTEDPSGSEDIYGLDISIAWHSADIQWRNGAPEGCIGGQSDVQPSDEQRSTFKRAVEIVEKLASRY